MYSMNRSMHGIQIFVHGPHVAHSPVEQTGGVGGWHD